MCGIAGIIDTKRNKDLIKKMHFIMTELQHRGHDGAGCAYSDGQRVKIEKGEGLFSNVIDREITKKIAQERPIMISCHTRYSTTGSDSIYNMHPFWLEVTTGRIALAVNGDTPNVMAKKKEMEESCTAVFYYQSDAEYILKYIFEAASRKQRNLVSGIKAFMKDIACAYSASLMIRDKLFLFRDPRGIRPLSYGRLGSKIIYASEDCALKKLKVEKIKEVEPGTIIEIDLGGNIKIHQAVDKEFCAKHSAKCIFELDYLARPDSTLFNDQIPVALFRITCGELLFKQVGIKPDATVGVLDSGIYGAFGYAEASGTKSLPAIIKNDYITRTFITYGQNNRLSKARSKYSMLPFLIKKYPRIAVIDDSMVRATTSREVIKMLFNAGAKEVHFMLVSPRVVGSCFYGISTPTTQELIAASKNDEQIRKFLGATTLNYLSFENHSEALKLCGAEPGEYCTACFNRQYPIPIN